MAALDASTAIAAVVSPSIEQVRIEAAGLDYVQIHGEIPRQRGRQQKLSRF